MEVEIGKKPSAWMPVIMSLGAIILVALQLGTHGIKPAIDEGAVARLWQLLLLVQLPVIVFFAYRWSRRAPRQAMTILAVQALTLLTAALPIFLFGW